LEQPTLRSTRLHLTEQQSAKGLRLDISLDCSDPDLTNDALITESIKLVSQTRTQWETQMTIDGRTIAPEA
jgi:hypothetical protein